MKGEIKGITVQWMHVEVLELKLTGVKCCCCCHDLHHILEFTRLTSHSPDQCVDPGSIWSDQSRRLDKATRVGM